MMSLNSTTGWAQMGVVLAVAAALLLAVAALIGPNSPSLWLRFVYVIAQGVGPLLLGLAVLYRVRYRIALLLRRSLIEVAGPDLISALPPRTVLAALLSRVFGDPSGHDVLITGLLGGAGRDIGGRDTAVSRGTSAEFRLERIGDACLSEHTWTHEYSGVQDNHQLVIFVTWDREIAELVVTERVFPLFELWVVEDEDQLEEFVPNLLENLRVGISYRDGEGAQHVVEPREYKGEEVTLREYDRYVRLPGSIDKRDLRIVRLDLHDLADPDHVVDAVELLTLSATSVSPFNLGYTLWSPPHPCFVNEVRFDVRELAAPDEDLVFRVLSSTAVRASLPINQWTRPEKGIIEVPIGAWMMPGHSVTLLWRVVD
jgi:hypothetical protein